MIERLITQHETKDISENPQYEFKSEGAIAAHMALMLHWLEVLNTPELRLAIVTPQAKRVFKDIVHEALNIRAVRANGLHQERLLEIGRYMDQIDELKNEIANLNRRLDTRNKRADRAANATADTAERHTPIPDHAGGNE